MKYGENINMIKKENRCCECDLPCMGNLCPNRNVIVLYCDCCGDECDTLYHFNGEHYCADCVLQELEIVRSEDYE